MKKRCITVLSMALLLFYTTCGFMSSYVVSRAENHKTTYDRHTALNAKKYKRKKIKQCKYNKNYIVIPKIDANAESLGKKYETNKILVEGSNSVINESGGFVANLSYAEACELQENKEVSCIEEDALITASNNDKDESVNHTNTVSDDWNKQIINMSEQSENLSQIKVAIIDSGVDAFNDVDLIRNVNFIPGEEEVLPLFWDTKGHGSAVAGIIAAEDNEIGVTGIAQNVDLYSARVLDHKNQAPVSRVVEAIYWAIDQDVDIINMSFGTNVDSQLLHNAILDAKANGILLIAAAGNESNLEYPAAYEEVMAVGSVTNTGKMARDSVSEEYTEIDAPGERVKTTGAFEGTIVCSGTSIATPHVVAVAAQLWGKDKSVSAEFIRSLLVKSANVENKILDEKQAEEIYSQYKDEYSETENDLAIEDNLESIEDNDSNIITYNNSNIEGRWSTETHEEISDSVANIDTLKYGAVFPDFASSGKKGMGANPAWHGYYVDSSGNNVNYLSNYIYLSRVANYIRTNNYLYAYSTQNTTYKHEICSYCENLPWEDLLGPRDGTRENRGYFVLGLSLHTLTDIFAHSVWSTTPAGRYTQICHNYEFKEDNPDESEPKNADNKAVVPGRFEAAVALAKKGIDRYSRYDSARVADFADLEYNGLGTTWKMRHLSDYAKEENCGKHDFNIFLQYTDAPISLSFK